MDSVRALGLALLVHAVVIALLAIHLHGGEAVAPPAPVIHATVVRETSRAPVPSAEQKKEQRQEQARRHAAELREQGLARERAAAERARQLAAKRKAEAAAKQKAEADKRRRERAEQERQAKQQLQQQLAAEEAQRAAAERARAAQEAEGYKSKIFARISRNWILPPSVDRALQCTVRVRLVPGGEVLSVTLVSPSGDANFDRSVENAVYKSSPLPVPAETAAFEQLRELELTFSPKDIQR